MPAAENTEKAMKWEELTAPEFGRAVEACGRVCILPIGVVEKHGDHVPLGMDYLHASYVAEQVAEREPAMVFPPYYFTHNGHAKCEPGAIAIRFELIIELLEAVCDEIARNGFERILILNSHGGNVSMIEYFCFKMLDREKPYSIYTVSTRSARPAGTAEIDGHGGESETSIMLAMRPELVKGKIADYGLPLPREEKFREYKVGTPTNWYSRHPDMLRGDRTEATAEKGKVFLDGEIATIAEVVRLIKTDDEPVRLYREFHARCQAPGR